MPNLTSSKIKPIFGLIFGLLSWNSLAERAPDNAIPNPDGSRTILRSQQLPDANERHARWCREHGGVDITNDGDLTLDSNAVDAVVCRRLDPSKPGFSGAYVPKNGPKDRINPGQELEVAPTLMPSAPLVPVPEQFKDKKLGEPGAGVSGSLRSLFPTISVYPNNAYTVKVKTLFYAASYAIFRDFSGDPVGRVVSSIPALGCTWRWQGPIVRNPHQVDGYVGCTAETPGVISTTIEACVSLVCASGEGAFVAEPL